MALDNDPLENNLYAWLPQTAAGSIEQCAIEMKALTARLAKAHDLTLTEATEVIEEWQQGFGQPTQKTAA